MEIKGRDGKFRYISGFGSMVLLACKSLNSGTILVGKNLQNKNISVPTTFSLLALAIVVFVMKLIKVCLHKKPLLNVTLKEISVS